MIEQFCGVCSDAMSTLLDAYQMKDWHMTWKEFLEQFSYEMMGMVEKWKTDALREDED